jgi:hypothetical protein
MQSRSGLLLLALAAGLVGVGRSHAEVLGAVPQNADQYEKIFGHQPIGNELGSVDQAVKAAHVPVLPLSSLAQYSDRAKNGKGLLILVGHNGQGEFKFSSGESVKLDELARIARENDRLGVFLTCNGACYTGAPAPRLKTTFKDAFTLAGEIEHRFSNLSSPAVSIMPAGTHSFSAPALTTDECAALFSKAGRAAASNGVASYAAISKEIQRTIFRAEELKVITGVAKIGGTGLAGSGFIYVTLSDRN